jgi:hypothetical protein
VGGGSDVEGVESGYVGQGGYACGIENTLYGGQAGSSSTWECTAATCGLPVQLQVTGADVHRHVVVRRLMCEHVFRDVLP